MPELTPLAEANAPEFGGKAQGLAQLLALGLRVPQGFVLTDPMRSQDVEALVEPVVREGRWAVRSSALGEDGLTHSFAGQYETYLDCEGAPAVAQAVRDCVRSASSDRVRHYAKERAQVGATELAVVVQRMVPARQAGVLFTADPVSGRRDRWVLETVDGLGEALVSGEADATRTVYCASGARLRGPGLAEELETALLDGARQLHRSTRHPMDIEFAIDDDGLWFLQGRPITGLSRVHFNEHDSIDDTPGAVYTTANISEMMPGPVTPLTWFVFGRAVDEGMQRYMFSIGAQTEYFDENRYIYMAYQHLFIRLDAVYASPRACLGASKQDVDLALVGRPVPEAELGDLQPWYRRTRNLARLAWYLRGAPKRVAQLEEVAKHFKLKHDGTAMDLALALEDAQSRLHEVYADHYAASVWSGTWLGVLTGAITGRGKVATAEDLALVSTLLADIPEIESADAVSALTRLGDSLRSHAEAARFAAAPVPEALAWLRREAGSQVDAFLERHGHRCVREAELRTRAWRDDPDAWVPMLQAFVRSPAPNRSAPVDGGLSRLEALPKSAQRTVRFALPRARRGVVLRERSKSALIAVQDHFKRSYRELGEMLVADGKLPDADLLYFLHPDEITLLTGNSQVRIADAEARREQLDALWALEFPVVSAGHPRPLPAEEPTPVGDWVGLPVSRGIAEGRAVVAKTLSDAKRLQSGDILVARITDVGWSPWFGVAGGLVTEIGSPLSHGAVVAREYGIPAVVGAKGAIRIPDGAFIRVDGGAGTVELLEGAPAAVE